MAALASLTTPGGAIGDTFGGFVIAQVLDAPGGKYRWRASSAASNLAPVRTATTNVIGNSAGDDATLELADTANAGLAAPFRTQTLTDAPTILVDASNGNCAVLTLVGNRSIDAPTNLKFGEPLIINVIQDGTGNRTLTWNAAYKFSSGSPPLLSIPANSRDVFYIFTHDGVNFTVAYNLDVR